jgi:non-ribosomal peptide synthetase component F
VCGNDLLESGEQCDGADDDGCPGACDATCQCPPSCREGAFADVRARIGREFTVRAVLMNGEGTYDELDPRASDLALSLSHRGVPVNVAIRAGDPGWTTSARNDRLYRWKGLQGRHRLRLTCRKLRNGNWQIIIRGREALVIDGAKPAA